MVCEQNKPRYISHAKEGINFVSTAGDGYAVNLDWTQAFAEPSDYSLAYNIYYSTNPATVFQEGVKAVSYDPSVTAGTLYDFAPGKITFFSVRAFEFDPTWYDLNLLPDGDPGFKIYPEGILISNITDTSIIIPISDIELWPAQGIVQIGVELILYSSKDIPSGSLLVSSLDNRGFLNTTIRLHNTDGYDGVAFRDPILRFFQGLEETNTVVYQATSTFKHPNEIFTNADGYRITTQDNLNTDLSASDAAQVDFASTSYSGWLRTDPVQLLKGLCIGTYYGGEQFCTDGYGIGFQLRGVPFDVASDQRLEELLSIEGQRVVLVKRLYAGLTCSCFEPSHQTPALRCPKCYGTGFITGYEQYFNPREADGRIVVKFDPAEDSVKLSDDGLESTFLPNSWTLSVPTIKNRDFIIRYNLDGTEEFRYEVLNVTRNVLLNSLSGAQKFSLQRVRRTDPIYMWKANKDTSTVPTAYNTGIGLMRGANGTMIPHTHSVTVNAGTPVSQINQTTSIVLGHNHEVRNGVVQSVVQHNHSLIIL